MLKLILFCLVLCFARIAFTESTPYFRSDYTYIESMKSYYKVHTTPREWSDAKNRCELEGATFFYPANVEEADVMMALWNRNHSYLPWMYLGISDLLSKGSFESIDGKSIKDIYNRWGEGEPNDRGGREDCVVVRKDATLNDDRCNKKFPFMCKKTAASIQWNEPCHMYDPGYIYNHDLGKCYKFHRDPMNWTQAYGICSAEDSYLAIINSQKESDYLVKLTEQTDKKIERTDYLSGHVHLGIHNLYEVGWTTIKGSTLEQSGFAVWGSGQPDNTGGNEKCGGMFFGGNLNDVSCDTSCFFICEHDIRLLNNVIDVRSGAVLG